MIKVFAKITLSSLLPLLLGMAVFYLILSGSIRQENDRQLKELRVQQEKTVIAELKARVDSAVSLIKYSYDHGYSKEHAKKLVNAIRFDDDNYIWIYRLDPERGDSAYIEAHADDRLIGKDLSGMIDLDRLSKLYYRGKI